MGENLFFRKHSIFGSAEIFPAVTSCEGKTYGMFEIDTRPSGGVKVAKSGVGCCVSSNLTNVPLTAPMHEEEEELFEEMYFITFLYRRGSVCTLSPFLAGESRMSAKYGCPVMLGQIFDQGRVYNGSWKMSQVACMPTHISITKV